MQRNAGSVVEAAPILWSLGDIDDYASAEAVCITPVPSIQNEFIHVAEVDFSYLNNGGSETSLTERVQPTTKVRASQRRMTSSTRDDSSVFTTFPGEYISPKFTALSQTFVLFENERCAPLIGWSAQNLKSTDCKRISFAGGTDSWDNTQQASDGLLSYGWQWVEDGAWARVPTHPWIYAVDFAALDRGLGTLKKTSAHYVRRRQFKEPTKEFGVFPFQATLTCDHCDLTEVTKIAQILLEYFVDISLLLFPTAKLSTVNTLVIKTALIPEKTSASKQYSWIDFQAFLYSWKQQLYRANNAPVSCSPAQRQQRENEAALCFSLYERMELARNIIRVHDRLNHSFHCGEDECGAACEFAVFKCPKNCGVSYSQKWSAHHAQLCAMKHVAPSAPPPPQSSSSVTSLPPTVVITDTVNSPTSTTPTNQSNNSAADIININISTAINATNNLGSAIAGGLRRASSTKMERFSLFRSGSSVASGSDVSLPPPPPAAPKPITPTHVPLTTPAPTRTPRSSASVCSVDTTPLVTAPSSSSGTSTAQSVIRCRYHDIGCKRTFTASDSGEVHEGHYSRNPQHHLNLAMSKIAADKKTIDDMCVLIGRLGGSGV